jgi:hypothetical protein
MLPDTFAGVSSASGPVFIFCAPRLVFGYTEGVWSCLHVLRSRTRFRRYRGRLVLFLCFALPDSFLTITKGDGSHLYVLGSRTRFRRYRGVPFSIFARPDSFSAASRALGPVFISYAPKLIFDGTKGVRYRFHVLRARTHFRRYRGRRIPISCFALPNSFLEVPRASGPFSIFFASGHIFGGTEVVGSNFHVLRSRLVFGGTMGV